MAVGGRWRSAVAEEAQEESGDRGQFGGRRGWTLNHARLLSQDQGRTFQRVERRGQWERHTRRPRHSVQTEPDQGRARLSRLHPDQ